MTNNSFEQMSEKQTEFAMSELTIEPDEIAFADELTAGDPEADVDQELFLEEQALALDAFRTEHEHDADVLDFTSGFPQIDSTLRVPIEADQALMKEIHAIPQKMAFKIGEAAEMCGVKQYVLRYWETEFEMLRPRKSANGQRIYSRKDVETALMIKKLLYKDRFSIEGARTALRALKSTVKSTVAVEKSTEKLVRSQETVVSMVQSLLTEIRRFRATLS